MQSYILLTAEDFQFALSQPATQFNRINSVDGTTAPKSDIPGLCWVSDLWSQHVQLYSCIWRRLDLIVRRSLRYTTASSWYPRARNWPTRNWGPPPRSVYNSELITITGTRDGIERARHEIQLVSDEQVRGSIVIDDQTHSVEGYLDIHSLNKF